MQGSKRERGGGADAVLSKVSPRGSGHGLAPRDDTSRPSPGPVLSRPAPPPPFPPAAPLDQPFALEPVTRFGHRGLVCGAGPYRSKHHKMLRSFRDVMVTKAIHLGAAEYLKSVSIS